MSEKDNELIRDYFILDRFTSFPYNKFEDKELEALMFELDKKFKELEEAVDEERTINIYDN